MKKTSENLVASFSISRKKSVPYHEQLLNQLRELILSSRLSEGDRLPSESEFSRALEISRNTVRQALSSAESEGLINRVMGKGSFVAGEEPRRRKPKLIGYIVSNFIDDGHREMIVASEAALRKRGYALMFASSHERFHEEYDIVDQFVRTGVSGLVIWPASAPSNSTFYQRMIDQSRIPVVFIDRRPSGCSSGSLVASDHRVGGDLSTSYLVSAGHRNIGFVSTTRQAISSIIDRYEGYRSAMHKAGLEPLSQRVVDIGAPELSFSGLKTILDRRPDIMEILGDQLQEERDQGIEAFVCVNDALAYLLSLIAEKQKLSLSFVGFDGSYLSRAGRRRFSSIVQDFPCMGEAAAELVLQAVEGQKSIDGENHIFPVRLQTMEEMNGGIEEIAGGVHE